MEMALRQRNIDFVRTKVGDRYVIEEMEKRQWILGGESSGHIICRKFSATGDGIVAALQVLAVILAKGQTLHQLKSAMHKLPQHMINIKVNKIPNLNSSSKLQAAINTVEKKLIGKGRVLLRSSGTESVVRVMVEGEDKLLIEKLAQQLAEQVTTLIC
jgi:phosphoglucosamine mutase